MLFDCQLCLKPISSSLKFINNGCSHSFCTDCITEIIGLRIGSDAGKIPCPGVNCETLLDPVSCKSAVSDEVYQRWLDVLCYSAIVGLENCYYPNKNCNALIVNECGRSEKRCWCPKCKKAYCFQCQIPWHNGRECNQVDQESHSLNDLLLMKLTVGDGKKLGRCPNCHMYVELVPKLGFCIIKCRCRTRFCYHCGRKCSKISCDCIEYKKEMVNYKNDAGIKVGLVVLVLLICIFICLVYSLGLETYDLE